MNPHVPSLGPLRIAVIGCGVMGAHHAKALRQMPHVTLAGVYDVSHEVAAKLARDLDVTVFESLEGLLRTVAAVTIAVPTRAHGEVALRCIDAGVACLIEKPLAEDIVAARALVDYSRRSAVTLQVGHIERFNPAVRAIKRIQMEPRFIEAIRVSELTKRSLDTSVVLDLMIHDLDIALWLAESEVTKVDAVGVSVTGETPDICHARVEFASGCVASFTASRLALRKGDRKLRVFSQRGFMSIDYDKRYGLVVYPKGDPKAIQGAVNQIRAGIVPSVAEIDYSEVLSIEELVVDEVDPLRAQLESFVNATRNRVAPEVGLGDGLAAVALAGMVIDALVAS